MSFDLAQFIFSCQFTLFWLCPWNSRLTLVVQISTRMLRCNLKCWANKRVLTASAPTVLRMRSHYYHPGCLCLHSDIVCYRTTASLLWAYRRSTVIHFVCSEKQGFKSPQRKHPQQEGYCCLGGYGAFSIKDGFCELTLTRVSSYNWDAHEFSEAAEVGVVTIGGPLLPL